MKRKILITISFFFQVIFQKLVCPKRLLVLKYKVFFKENWTCKMKMVSDLSWDASSSYKNIL